MEKPGAYELTERKDGDKLQLITGSTASTLPRDHSGFEYQPSVIDSTKQANDRHSGPTCLQNCCLLIVGAISVLALCAAVVAIILIVGFPNVTNPAVQEVLTLKDQLMSQTGSTASPASIDLSPISEEMRMTREALQSSINSLGDTLSAIRISLEGTGQNLQRIRDTIETSVSSFSSSLGDTLTTVRTSLEGTGQDLQRIRDTIETAANVSSNSLGDRITTVSRSVDSNLGPMSTLLERLVKVQENETCMNLPEPPIGSVGNPASSCRDIPADSPSGDYWIQTDPNTCPIRVYCDLDGSACSCRCDTTQGGWMRVANFDMKDPNQNCPDEFTEVTNNDPPLRLCGRPGAAGCSTMNFPVNGIEYSRVCGKVIGYRKGTPDGLHNRNAGIDGPYMDGVSITHGTPRTHIWTFVTTWAFTQNDGGCPCDTNNYQGGIPSFVGTDYFCEGGHTTTCCDFNLIPDNPVWDGEGCVEGSSCCVLNSPPYFCKTLDTPTTDTIEVRVCGSQGIEDEDNPIEVVELYVY